MSRNRVVQPLFNRSSLADRLRPIYSSIFSDVVKEAKRHFSSSPVATMARKIARKKPKVKVSSTWGKPVVLDKEKDLATVMNVLPSSLSFIDAQAARMLSEKMRGKMCVNAMIFQEQVSRSMSKLHPGIEKFVYDADKFLRDHEIEAQINSVIDWFNKGNAGSLATPLGNTFMREGDGWKISWKGKELPFMKHEPGLSYIAELIRLFYHETEKRYAAPAELELVEKHVPDAPGLRNFKQMGKNRRADEGLSERDGPERGMERLDNNAKLEYMETIKDLRKDLEEADEQKDWARKEHLQVQIDEIEKQLLDSLDPVRHRHIFKEAGVRPSMRKKSPTTDLNEQKNVYSRLRMAITRALRNIKKLDKDLYNHLDKSIDTTVSLFCYSPESDPHWDL